MSKELSISQRGLQMPASPIRKLAPLAYKVKRFLLKSEILKSEILKSEVIKQPTLQRQKNHILQSHNPRYFLTNRGV